MDDPHIAAEIAELNRSIEELDREIDEYEDNLINVDERLDKDEVEALKGRFQEIKNDQENLKTQLNKFMQGITQSGTELDTGVVQSGPINHNEEGETMKKRTIELGIQISRLLVTTMIMRSDIDSELEKFEGFRFSLEDLSDEKSSAMKKIAALIGMVDRELGSNKKTKINLESSAGSSGEMKESESEERVLTASCQLDELLNKFRQVILDLNSIMMNSGVGVADSKNLTENDVSSLDASLQKCEEDLKTIEKEVNELAVLSPHITESPKLQNLKGIMEKKINEEWKSVCEDEKE